MRLWGQRLHLLNAQLYALGSVYAGVRILVNELESQHALIEGAGFAAVDRGGKRDDLCGIKHAGNLAPRLLPEEFSRTGRACSDRRCEDT